MNEDENIGIKYTIHRMVIVSDVGMESAISMVVEKGVY
jgi:hypothetical protein